MQRLPLHWTGTRSLRIAILLTMASLLLGTTACRRGEFDSAAWKAQAATPGYDRERNQMLIPLDKKLHAGMSRDAVIDLLGQPDGTNADHTRDSYGLGRAPYGIDPEYLIVEYKDGKLVRTVMTRG